MCFSSQIARASSLRGVGYFPFKHTTFCKSIMHPLHDFIYCPHCGAQSFEENDAYSKHCMHCGFTYYPNAAAATVAVIINDSNELLCIRRGREPAKGTLDLPGGFVDPGESITDGLLREVREELCTEVATYQFLFSFPNLYPYSGHNVHTADAFFLCRLKDPTAIVAHDDAAAVLWIPLSAVQPADFGLASVRHGVEQVLKMQLP